MKIDPDGRSSLPCDFPDVVKPVGTEELPSDDTEGLTFQKINASMKMSAYMKRVNTSDEDFSRPMHRFLMRLEAGQNR